MRQDGINPRTDARSLASDRDETLVLAVIGAGRAGRSIARAAANAGLDPRIAGRGGIAEVCSGAGATLICVPDTEIETACEEISACGPPGPVGHVSGATGLDALAAAAKRGAQTFSLHPLQTIPDHESDLLGAPCAVSGATPAALDFADSLARRLGLRPFELDDRDRVAYHAAACMASNFLVALEESAATLLERAGMEDGRELLAPVVLRTAANWSQRGADALTGPIARGDEATVSAHLEALADRAPELLDAYRAMAARARAIAAERDAEEAVTS